MLYCFSGRREMFVVFLFDRSYLSQLKNPYTLVINCFIYFFFLFNRWYKKIVWLFFHPLAVIYFLTLGFTVYTFDELTIKEILLKSIEAMQHLIALNVTDAMVYGNWTFVVINVVILSTWLSFWSLMFASSEERDVGVEKEKAE